MHATMALRMSKLAVVRLAIALCCLAAFLFLSHLSRTTFSDRYPNFIDLVVSGNPYGRFCLTGKSTVVTAGKNEIVVEREGFRLKIIGVSADSGDTVFASGTLTARGLIPSQAFVVKGYVIKRAAMYVTGFLVLLLTCFHLLRHFIPPSIRIVRKNG